MRATKKRWFGYFWVVFELWSCGSALAGGHFDVDDAATLNPGQCQYEIWHTQSSGAFADVMHGGPACRLGAVELGVNFEQVPTFDQRQHVLGPQVKWAFWGDAQSSVGMALSASAFHETSGHGKAGGQVVVPITLRPVQSLQIHANAGLDWTTGDGVRTRRYGVAGEWAANERVSLILERNRSASAWTSRLGMRFNITPFMSIDVSSARTGPGASRSYVLGLNGQFSR